ncbi:TALPID3 protein-like isoform X2 [Liolophura sinensis]|uniref:TALPID3 protein-like isoform X2 n=1 Tax=Liolophura sinensis TaxID=3198878 RepID=UPI0031587C93
MARFVADMYSDSRGKEVPVAVPDSTHGHTDSDSESGSASILGAVGGAGLQLFVDAGQPVNSQLVSEVIKEVLQEKIASLLGEFPEREEKPLAERAGSPNLVQEERAGGSPSPKPSHSTKPLPRSPRKVIPTPEPTPRSSPVASSPPATSPVYTPIQSVEIEEEMSPVPQAPVEPKEEAPVATLLETSLEPSSASVDIVDMMNKIAATVTFPVEEGPVVQTTGAAATPIASPEPPHDMREPEEVIVTPPLSGSPVRTDSPLEADLARGSPRENETVSPLPKKEVVTQTDMETPTQTPQPERIDMSTSISNVKPMQDEVISLSQSDITSLTSSLTETVNESLSEGQWLVSHSEGQLPHIALNEAVRLKVQTGHNRLGDFSLASTLRDTEDLETDISHSEGEFCHQSLEDPTGMLALLNKIQAGAGFYQYDLTLPDVQAVLNQTGASTGEISLGQQVHRLSPPHKESRRSGRQSEDRQPDRQLNRQTDRQLDRQTSAPKVTVIQSLSATDETGGDGRSEQVNEAASHDVVPRPSILKKSQELGGGRRGQKSSGPGGRFLASQMPLRRDSTRPGRGNMEEDLTASRKGTGSLTPDQMRTDVLISQTFSQSEGRATSAFNQSRELRQSLNRSEDLGSLRASYEMTGSDYQSHSVNQSVDLAQSTHTMNTASASFSETELRHMAEFGTGSGTGPRVVSVTIPGQGQEDTNSEGGDSL